MRTADMIKSNFISRAEVKNAGQMILTIIDCTLEKAGSDDKWVLWFNEHPKGLALNNTKIRLLEAAYGDDSSYWNGRRVRLTFDPTVTMAGQVVGGIKLACSTVPPQAGANYPAKPVYAPEPQAGRRGGATPGQGSPSASPGAPPQAVWDNGRWVLPDAGSPTVDKDTGEILSPRPATISERVNAAHPPVGSPENEFGDEIPF